MKNLVVLGFAVFMLLTAVEPIWAADDASTSSTSIATDSDPFRASDLGMRLNPQIGMSSFSYSGGAGGVRQKPTGGLTIELGDDVHKLETGLLYMQTGANATLNSGDVTQISSSYVALPMMAKLRVVHLQSQSWYAKFGILSAFQTQSSDRADTNAFDVLGSAGMEGRFPFTHSADFIVDATYNRGFMNTLDTAQPGNFNQGIMVLAGLSFRL